jgi:cytochrome c oxidase subunit 3
MSSTTATKHHADHPPWYRAHHYDDQPTQDYAARLGMWLFLGTEVLLFAGLFVAYTVFRYLYPATFQECSRHLDLSMGLINTIVLITSSFTVAWGYHAVKANQPKKGAALILLTIALAGVFLVVKFFEYKHKFEVGTLPGKWYTFEGIQGDGANLFYTVYFLATGLHGFHVIVGMTVLIVLLVRLKMGKYSAAYYVPIELGALYWHLVDLVWIFLFPLLYLI